MGQRRGKTKRQHYVPRLLLRSFSSDPQRRMLCVRTRERTVVGASMRDQCYSDYLYGADGSVECQGSGELIGLSSGELIHRIGAGRTRKVEAGALRPQLG